MTSRTVWNWRSGLRELGAAGAVFLALELPLFADDTFVATGAACRYQVPTSDADGTNWTTVAFDDSSWDQGASGIGYENGSGYASLFGATVPSKTVTFYARFAFSIAALTNYDNLILSMKYDDGFVAYLNGVEVARANAPETLLYSSTATALHADTEAVVFQDYDISAYLPLLQTGTNVLAVHALNDSSSSSDFLMLPELTATQPSLFTNVVINEFMAVNDSTVKNSLGKYGDWVELYNPFSTNVNLAGWYLTDNASKLTKWQFPSGSASTISAKSYLLVWTDDKSYSLTNSELHTSFSLSGSGEYLGLVRPDGVTVVHQYAPTFPEQCGDISYGLGETGESRYFATPTPGAANAFDGGSNEVGGVKFSPKRGVYTNAMPQVAVTASTEGSVIRYTTDCEAPTEAGALYSAPFDLSHTTVFRAAAYKSGFAPSDIDTHTYVSADDALRQSATQTGYPTNWSTYTADYAMDQSIVSAYGADLTNALRALPSISIVTTVSNLFDATTGIYTHPTSTGTSWERESSVEWIDPDNDSRFQIGCGLQIQGGAFRGFNYTRKKSFAFQFRGTYGETSLDEDLFSDSGGTVTSLDDLVLRAGANDAWNVWGHQKTQYIVDEFTRRSFLAMGGWSPHGRFVHLYLNGMYWGIYNVTEKVSSEQAAAVYGGNEDTWDVRSQDAALDGDYTAWNAMVNLLRTNVVDNAIYQRVQGNDPDGSRNLAYPVYLDVQNYIDYLIVQYWSANVDWPNNNWRAFRDRNASLSTGFKFAVWDAEATLGVWGDLTTDRTAPAYLLGVAVMHSNLLANAEYRLRFADRVQKHLFNGGELTAEKVVPRYQELADTVEPAMVAESARWGDQDGNAAHTVAQWRTQRDYVLGTFLPQRGTYALQYFRNRGLYPTNAAPTFSQFGGLYTNSLSLTMSASTPIYYTTDGSDPRQYGTGAVTGVLYTNGVTLTRTTRVKARARSATTGEWSALTEAVFTPKAKPALRVTELMYHPRKLDAAEGLDGDDEFIELQNAGAATVGLAGLKFTEGVTFDFADSAVQMLEPGEYLLVVKNLEAFTNRYPSVSAARIAGVFAYPAQSLDNGGEKIVLEDAEGRSVVSFTYNNTWFIATDGAGHSLVPLSGVSQSDGELDYSGNWRASAYIGGSPGAADPTPPATTLVLNEILAHTDYDDPVYDSNDGIELYNATDQTIALGVGWYLSDDPDDLTKWAIPATNSVAACGWHWFDEVHDFHSPITNGFGLNKAGDQVFLSYLSGTGEDRVVDAIAFSGEENNVPLIRFPDGADDWVYGVPTPGASNQLAETDVQISEVMYHPAPTAENPGNNENDEYVEIYNPTTHAVTLMDLVEDAGAWQLSGGIDFTFPDDTVLPAGGRLVVVSFDPSSDTEELDAFLAAYSLTNGQARLFGPFDGQLNNKTDAVRLERPVAPDTADEDASWHVVDGVTYYDDTPWPTGADGTGCALDRVPGRNCGNDPGSWIVGFGASPGAGAPKIAVTAPAANTGYAVPATVEVSAEIEPIFVEGSVHSVVFAVDGVDAATVSNTPYSASIALDAVEGGRAITARLTDDEGVFTSAAVPITTYTNVPTFSAGEDQSINLTVTDSVNLYASVENLDGTTNDVHYVWSCSSADGSVVLSDTTQSVATATFTQAGVYELVLTLYYGQLVTNRCITVTVSTTNTVNSIPYKEGFESYTLDSTLIGVHGWYGASAEVAVIATNRFASGTGDTPLSCAHTQSLGYSGSVTNEFADMTGLTNVCMDMLIGTQHGDDDQPVLDSDVQLGFRFNEAQHLVVWHGVSGSTNRWTEITDVTAQSNAYVRLTVMADYARDAMGSFKFRVWVDRVAVTNPAVWFESACTNRNYLSGIVFRGEGQVDDLVVDDYNSMLYRRIIASAGEHGCVEPAGELYVPVGTSTNIAVIPDTFYDVGSVSVDGLSVGATENYTFTNVCDEHTLTADFVARLTTSGVPELWLNGLNPAWVDNFEAHAREDSDGDGIDNGAEYEAGTDATNAQSLFMLDLRTDDGASILSFPTVPFEDAYGLSRSRHYALEQSDDLTAGEWQDVEGWDDVVGDGQPVVYTNNFEGTIRFFRGRVWLEP